MTFTVDTKNRIKIFYGDRLGEVRGHEPATREECLMWDLLEWFYAADPIPWGDPTKERIA